MAEEKTRIDKVREYLYEAEEPVRPKTIAEVIGESSLNVGKDLHRLKEQGQAESEGDGLWKMTHEGKEALEGGGGREKGKGEKEREISETVPSQCDVMCNQGNLAKTHFTHLSLQTGSSYLTLLLSIFSVTSGNSTKNVAPFPGLLLAYILPPCSVTIP